MQTKNTNLRLQREAKKAFKEQQTMIKKQGKITNNFVYGPNPENLNEWFFVVFGLDDHFKGGYYLGSVVCPDSYPQKPPSIKVHTMNGRFCIDEGICLSVTEYHPESWNPAWTVSHIILGLITFWLSDEDTAGVEYHNSPADARK
mmetsp:Transcript_311/g.264  ORF Transcript_311/g.264 Transcript_311/m.264 type:complete len:145 (+) Transcript_311:28-462(+)